MPILNNQGITSYARKQPIGREGDLHTEPARVRALQNPILAQISTVTYAAVADVSDEIVEDQVFTITVTEPDGTVHTVSHTVTAADATAGTDANGLAYMAVQMVTDFNAEPTLYGVATAARPAGLGATGTNGAVVITFSHPGIDYVVDASITPAASETTLTDTVATSQAAGGSGIPLGRFVTSGGTGAANGELLELPDAAADDIVGILARSDVGVNQAGSLSTDLDTLPPGYIGAVVEEGEVLMRNNGAAVVPRAAVYAVVSTSGGDALGEAHSALEGTAQVCTFAPTADLSHWGIQLTVNTSRGLRTFTAHYEATDGTTAVADAIDGLFDALSDSLGGATSAANGIGVTVTESDTLLTVTADAGVEIVDLTANTWIGDTEAVCGTAVVGTWAPYTKLVPGARWVQATAAGAIGPVRIDI